jgi:hypothetical protein
LHFFRPVIDGETDSSSDFEDTSHNAYHTDNLRWRRKSVAEEDSDERRDDKGDGDEFLRYLDHLLLSAVLGLYYC